MAGEEERLKGLLRSLVETDIELWPEDREEVLEIAVGLHDWMGKRQVGLKIGVLALAALLLAELEEALPEEKEVKQ